VQVHYDEGVAIYIGPEPCVGVREDGDEILSLPNACRSGDRSCGRRCGQKVRAEQVVVHQHRRAAGIRIPATSIWLNWRDDSRMPQGRSKLCLRPLQTATETGLRGWAERTRNQESEYEPCRQSIGFSGEVDPPLDGHKIESGSMVALRCKRGETGLSRVLRNTHGRWSA
jgi:hypothetical protein